jgi:uncharacterized protein
MPDSNAYRPAWWVPGRHAQTIWGRVFRRRRLPPLRTERWTTPDGDFLNMLRMDASADAPRLFVLHGLEGTVRSHYVSGLMAHARQRGWGADLMLFRGCGGELNTQPRFYHSGETGDLDFALNRVMREHPDSPIVMVGVSLGGNVLLKWLGEHGQAAPRAVRGGVAISVPFDLERGARHLQRGFSRIYDRHFLRSLKRKALLKLERIPGFVDAEAVRRARSIYEFDDCFTAPVHGFTDAGDYYKRSSSLRFVHAIRRPTLLISAVDDPFLPPEVLGEVRVAVRDNPCVTLEFPARGGHVGFVSGRVPWRPVYYAEWRAVEFLAQLV